MLADAVTIAVSSALYHCDYNPRVFVPDLPTRQYKKKNVAQGAIVTMGHRRRTRLEVKTGDRCQRRIEMGFCHIDTDPKKK